MEHDLAPVKSVKAPGEGEFTSYYVLEYDGNREASWWENHLSRQSNSQNGYRYIYDGDGQLVVKINETTGERSIYLRSYADVTYTGAAAATPTATRRVLCERAPRSAQP